MQEILHSLVIDAFFSKLLTLSTLIIHKLLHILFEQLLPPQMIRRCFTPYAFLCRNVNAAQTVSVRFVVGYGNKHVVLILHKIAARIFGYLNVVSMLCPFDYTAKLIFTRPCRSISL